MKYSYCIVRTKRNHLQLTDFLKNYLTDPIGFIQHVYTNKNEKNDKLLYIAISSVDLKRLHDNYGFKNYNLENDISIEDIEIKEDMFSDCPLKLSLPNYTSEYYKKQLNDKLNKLVELEFIKHDQFNIRNSSNSCVITFEESLSLKDRFIIKTILNNTYWYNNKIKKYYLCKAEWNTFEISIKENFDSIYSNIVPHKLKKNIKLVSVPANLLN